MSVTPRSVAAGLVAAALILGAAPAVAEPPPPPAPMGEVPPAWAPTKPAETWSGQPVVWYSGWGGRWGVWLNGQFIILSSNNFTNGE